MKNRPSLRSRRPGRQPALDGELSSWIVAGRRSFFDYSVGSYVPAVFEGYARLLHPAWKGQDLPVRWDAVASWSGRTIHALAQWERISRPSGPAAPGRPFDREPRTGGLPPAQLGILCDRLARFTSTPQRCFAGVWEGYGWIEAAEPPLTRALRLDQREYLIVEGPLDVARRIGWRFPGGELAREPPTLLWPSDRAWFVAGDTDLDSTYVGGSADLISMLLTDPGLEAWPVEPGDDASSFSDVTNLP